MISEGKREDVLLTFSSVADTCNRLGDALTDYCNLSPISDIKTNLLATAELAKSERDGVKEPFKLGVVGMFKAGKSAVINTLLERVVLREGRTEATSVVTELRFADSVQAEQGTVSFRDGRVERMSVTQALEYTDIRSEHFRGLSVEQQKEFRLSIQRVMIELHCEFLRNLTLMDTPGFGGSNAGNEKAFEALHAVDAALMIFSADRVGAENELQVADYLQQRSRMIVVLLNKVDDGHGNMRSVEDLQASEAFIKENFRTVLADKNGEPLIFRYSARHVGQALEVLRQPNLNAEQLKAAQGELGRWGYTGTDDSELGRGVRAFLKERYFSSSGETTYARKLETGRKSILNSLQALINQIEEEEKTRASQVAEDKSAMAQQRAKIRQNILVKKLEVDAKIDDLIHEEVMQFARELGQAMNALLERQANLDMASLYKAFRNKETISGELEAQFREYFPVRREERMNSDVERKLKRLLQTQWTTTYFKMQQIDPSIKIPDATSLTNEMNRAVQGTVFAIAGTIAGWVALLFVPGGAVVGVAIWAFSEIAGVHFGAKHRNELFVAQQKIHIQIENYASSIRAELQRNAQAANDEMAASASNFMMGDTATQDKAIERLEELSKKLSSTRGELSSQRRVLTDLEIAMNHS